MIYLITDRCDPPDEKETLKCAICIDFKFYKNKTKQTNKGICLEAGALATCGGTQIYLEKDSLSKTNEFNVCEGAVIKDKGI